MLILISDEQKCDEMHGGYFHDRLSIYKARWLSTDFDSFVKNSIAGSHK